MVGLMTVEQRVGRDFARVCRRAFIGCLAARLGGERGGDATHRLARFEGAKHTPNATDRDLRGLEPPSWMGSRVASAGPCHPEPERG